MMPDDTPLTDLCSVCYNGQPKYRCPRCKTRTCSLACSQKHKQRASCNGVRDPAEYLKRSQLATPVGIDRDYNYLKGVERDIEVANRDTRERGVGLVTKDAPKAVSRARHPEGALQRYLLDNRINVQRAPLGMSRQKTNQTRSTKSKTLLWTAEFINSEGEKHTSHMVDAKAKIREVWKSMQSERIIASTRQSEGNNKTRTKRKRAEATQNAQKTAKTVESAAKEIELVEETDLPVMEKSIDDEPAISDKAASNDATRQPHQNHSTVGQGTDQSSLNARKLRFYLLRPGTSTSAKVLIPLDAEASLTQNLQDRTVLEYPTIYGLSSNSDELPEGFLTEEQYLRMRKREDGELREALDKAGPLPSPIQQSDSVGSDVDPQRVLDMLKRDVTR